ncbi:MAG: hypothetical protein WDO17_06830 [Alphaproteobacteria bacterium]
MARVFGHPSRRRSAPPQDEVREVSTRISSASGDAIVVARNASHGRQCMAREQENDAHRLRFRLAPRAGDRLTFIQPYDLCDRHGGLLFS